MFTSIELLDCTELFVHFSGVGSKENTIPRASTCTQLNFVVSYAAGGIVSQYSLLFIHSAYCGGLWLASLRVMQEIADVLGVPEEAVKYVNTLKRGKKAYNALLWNGKLS